MGAWGLHFALEAKLQKIMSSLTIELDLTELFLIREDLKEYNL